MKKIIIRIAIVVVLLLVLAVVVGAFFLGSIVKKGVETVGPSLTKTQVKLDGASLSVLSGSGSINGLFIGNPEGFKTESAIKVSSVKLALRPGSVFSDKVHVTQVEVQAPEITFEGSLKGNNLSKILDNVQSATGGKSAGAPAEKSSSKKMQIDDLVISGGKIHLSATMLGGKSATVPLPDIHLTDLGKDSNGLTAGEVTEKVLKEVTQGTLKAVEKAMLDLGKGATDAVKGVSKTATEGAQKATKSVTDLFKKK